MIEPINLRPTRTINRRRMIGATGAVISASWIPGFASAVDEAANGEGSALQIASRLGVSYRRVRGLLIGALLGDALGGPVEFLDPDRLPSDLPRVRQWKAGTKLDDAKCESLAKTLKLRGYETLRPDTAPFGPWRKQAPAGTLTDDSRHKIIVMRALKRSLDESHAPSLTFDRAGLAGEYLRPLRHVGEPEATTQALDREGFKPYRDAARWWTKDLVQADSTDSTDAAEPAYPPQRLWAGVANCSGQMALLPLAAVFAGRPTEAYKATAAVDFLDADHAIDFCAAINAGIAEVLSSRHDAATPQVRFQTLLQAMNETDPFDYTGIPYTGRPFTQWLDRARRWSDQADGEPHRLFKVLETDGKPHYWWDAHFTFVVPLSILHFCPENPLAALNLCLDFGHDTDSYAQLLAAWIGAIHGDRIFPASMVRQVEQRLKADFDESVDDWCLTLLRVADRVQSRQLRFER